jgi:hypothetical protein
MQFLCAPVSFKTIKQDSPAINIHTLQWIANTTLQN